MKTGHPQIEFEDSFCNVAINFSQLKINKNLIEASLGYPENTMPEHFAGIIENIISEMEKYIEIKAGYRIVRVERPLDRRDGLLVNGTFLNLHKIVTGQLKKAEKAAVFICTIGQAMENWSKQLISGGEIMLGYMVDAIASATVENVTDLLHDYIGDKMLGQGLKITNRYSPGYCNWSVSEQHQLFSILNDKSCGIKLTESALMIPIKSISGIIGVGADVKRVDYICDRCGVKDCTHRLSL